MPKVNPQSRRTQAPAAGATTMAELARLCAAKRQRQASCQESLRAAVRDAVEALGGVPDLQGGWTLRCPECGEKRTVTLSGEFFIRDSSAGRCEAMNKAAGIFNGLRREHRS